MSRFSSRFSPSCIIKQKKYTVEPQGGKTSSNFCSDQDEFYNLDSIIKHRESRTHEFKAAQGNYIVHMLPQTLARYACAFTNGEGGTLYLGILDDGTVKGVPWNDRFDQRKVESVVKNTLRGFLPYVPSYNVRIVPVYQAHYTKYSNQVQHRQIPNKRVVRIEVHQGDLCNIWETGDHEVWVKRDGSVEPLNPLQIKDLAISRYKQTLNMRGAKRKQDNR